MDKPGNLSRRHLLDFNDIRLNFLQWREVGEKKDVMELALNIPRLNVESKQCMKLCKVKMRERRQAKKIVKRERIPLRVDHRDSRDHHHRWNNSDRHQQRLHYWIDSCHRGLCNRCYLEY